MLSGNLRPVTRKGKRDRQAEGVRLVTSRADAINLAGVQHAGHPNPQRQITDSEWPFGLCAYTGEACSPNDSFTTSKGCIRATCAPRIVPTTSTPLLPTSYQSNVDPSKRLVRRPHVTANKFGHHPPAACAVSCKRIDGLQPSQVIRSAHRSVLYGKVHTQQGAALLGVGVCVRAVRRRRGCQSTVLRP